MVVEWAHEKNPSPQYPEAQDLKNDRERVYDENDSGKDKKQRMSGSQCQNPHEGPDGQRPRVPQKDFSRPAVEPEKGTKSTHKSKSKCGEGRSVQKLQENFPRKEA